MSKAKQTTSKTTTSAARDFAALQQTFIESAVKRSIQPENASCKTIVTDIKNFSNEAFKRQLESAVNNGFIDYDALESLAKNISICDKKHNDYVALKVISKIDTVIDSLATKNKNSIQAYVKTVFENMIKNQSLTNKSAHMVLSRDFEYTSTDKVQTLKKVIHVKTSTAETQMSQIKQVLRLLKLADINKGQRDVELSFNDSIQSKAIIAFFAE